MSEIRINGVTFESNVTATDGTIGIEYKTNDKLDAIEEQFKVGLKVEVIERGEVVAIYYNKALKSLQITERDPRKVRVVLEGSPVNVTTEKKLSNKIKEVSDALKENASDTEGNAAAIEDLAKTISGQAEDAEITSAAFAELAELVSLLMEKVTALETKEDTAITEDALETKEETVITENSEEGSL